MQGRSKIRAIVKRVSLWKGTTAVERVKKHNNSRRQVILVYKLLDSPGQVDCSSHRQLRKFKCSDRILKRDAPTFLRGSLSGSFCRLFQCCLLCTRFYLFWFRLFSGGLTGPNKNTSGQDQTE